VNNTLLEIVDGAVLFHTPDQTAYANIEVSGHRENWQVRSTGFRDWLISSYYSRTGAAPNSNAVGQALCTAEAKARFSGCEHPIYVRVGRDDDAVYLDLADADWRAIRIDAGGWTIDAQPRVRFVRPKGMLPLPLPLRGGSIEKLRDFINVRANEDFILVIAWLLAALRGAGPYPVLAVTGEQGSAKSTLMEILRLIVDPNQASLRSPPRAPRDLFISATNAHVLAFDNLSSLPAWLSDDLARISTGAAFATRELYSNAEEKMMRAANPIALNGITDIVSREDLADRSVFVTGLRPHPGGTIFVFVANR
jgi:hypothetical protein